MSNTRTPEIRHNLNKEIGYRCKHARLSAGLTQETLAEKLDVSTQYLSDMERGKVGLSLLTLLHISDILSVSTDYLLKGFPAEKSCSIQVGTRTISLSEQEYCILEKNINTLLEAFQVNKNPI